MPAASWPLAGKAQAACSTRPGAAGNKGGEQLGWPYLENRPHPRQALIAMLGENKKNLDWRAVSTL